MEQRKKLEVECYQCKTSVTLDVIDDGFSFLSTDQAAQFIQVPKFKCGKCGSDCRVDLITVEIQ